MKMKTRAFLILALIGTFLTLFLAPLSLAAAVPVIIFDDMEHGDPLNNGWFAFGGSVGGGGISANSTDLPPTNGGAFSLDTGWGSGGVAGFYGGFGRTNLTDLSTVDTFNFWINPDAGQDYTLEINLQDDDTGDDAAVNTDNDDEFQFNCVVSAAGPCAISGGGWQQVSIPLADFFDDNSFYTAGNGVLDAVPVASSGNGQLVNVVFAVIGTGSDVNFRTDYWAFSSGTLGEPSVIIDDFESGLPSGTDGDGNLIGFYQFEGPDAVVGYSATDTPPAPVPDAASGNTVLQLDTNVPSGSWGGVVHAFENEAVDTWVTQDWSTFVGISFWLYGNNTGSVLFLDVLDNRAPGTTGDTAERFSIDIVDNFSGWQFFEIPFADLNRKEVGNGAPNDGLNLTDVHGWGLGVFSAGQAFSNYLDDVSLYGTAEVPELSVGFTANNFDIAEGATGQITVSLNRSMGDDDPAQVSVDYAVALGTAVPDRDYIHPPAGTLTFVKGGPSELSFSLETLDDSKYEGDERVILRLSNPVDAAPGFIMQAAATITDNENYDPLMLDDFELGAYLWDSSGDLTLSTPGIGSGDPLALPGQGAYETILSAAPVSGDSPLAQIEQVRDDLSSLLPAGDHITNLRIKLAEYYANKSLSAAYWTDDYYLAAGYGQLAFIYDGLAVHFLMKVAGDDVPEAAAAQDAIDHLLTADEALAQIALNRAVANNGRSRFLDKAESELVKAQEDIANGRFDKAVDHYRLAWLFAGRAVKGMTLSDPSFGRDFALGEDWSLTDGITFMYYGQGTGDAITLELLDNRAPDPGPSGWSLAWSDEFDDPAGTPPNPANWGSEIGDGTANGNLGWGNGELQYYTASTENAATDGNGNLVISAKEADGSLQCYYGPCEYTSARLISWHKAEFAYGRIESRIQVPDGEDGLWPAFWSLGTDIDRVGWPQTGEIDIMEYVSRIPDEIFGTIHGPGYSGGSAFGSTYPFPGGVAGSYHTFTIEWQPDLIEWYVDGILYHTATPADVAPNEWVFNDPVFLIFNLAIGGNFGGAVSEDLTMPQDMVIDYVRVYQGPDTAERFEAAFTDDFTGWQEVFVPYDAFTRSADQPAGAPNDGLTLTDVWGYGFKLPVNSATATAMVDQVRLVAPVEVTVTNNNDSGSGSLREAINLVATDGLITFDPGLASSTISLTSGALTVNKAITIDGSGAPALTVSGNNASRVFEIGASASTSINNLTIANGSGETGAGIYVGEGGSLTLLDTTVEGNSATGDGGGLFAALATSVHVERSTFSGNSGGVGGGLRTLGNATISNSTISGNTATGWWGGAIFHTDGVMDIVNSTITGNVGPDWAPSAIFVGSWAPDQLSTINMTNSIVVGNQWIGCYAHAEGGGTPTLASGGHNIASDDTCNLTAAGDQPNTDPLLGLLADNGGLTLTHALLAGSPAIDAADTAVCPPTDQRGITRDAACDVGAFEFVP